MKYEFYVVKSFELPECVSEGEGVEEVAHGDVPSVQEYELYGLDLFNLTFDGGGKGAILSTFF